MNESITGFTVQGSWGDVIDHGEQLSTALTEAGVEGEVLEEWDEWRPKADDSFQEEMSDKTAAQASLTEGEGEQAEVSSREDLQTASDDATEAYNELAERDTDDAIKKGRDSVGTAARAADTASRKVIRSAEETVYRYVMTQISPQYFDNELISANLQQTGDTIESPLSGEDGDDSYVFEVNINDDNLKDEIGEQLDTDDTETDQSTIE